MKAKRKNVNNKINDEWGENKTSKEKDLQSIIDQKEVRQSQEKYIDIGLLPPISMTYKLYGLWRQASGEECNKFLPQQIRIFRITKGNFGRKNKSLLWKMLERLGRKA